jgi:hypothetical protein
LRYVGCVIPSAVCLPGIQESSRPMALKTMPAEHPTTGPRPCLRGSTRYCTRPRMGPARTRHGRPVTWTSDGRTATAASALTVSAQGPVTGQPGYAAVQTGNDPRTGRAARLPARLAAW